MRGLTPLLALQASLVAALWPIPSSYKHGNQILWIDESVKVSYKGHTKTGYYGQRSAISSDEIVQAAIYRTREIIASKTFIPWKFNARNTNFEPSTSKKKLIRSITLEQTAADPANFIKPLAGEVDEAYKLDVSASGKVTVTAASSIGLVRGLTTFSQLFFAHSKGGSYTNLAPVAISDRPKFAHRGLNMDVARNFYPVAAIKRQIDALAYSKMNRLHLHVTDGQSWPLEVPSMPSLAEKGRYAPGLTYSEADIREVQRYGAAQGVQVYLEIDMPGHTSSVWFSRPELITAFNIQPDWNTYCAEPPCGSLKLNSAKVVRFLKKLLDDVLPRVKPYTAYFHTGGDEVNVNAYALDETVRSSDTAAIRPLMQKFVDRNHDQVRKAGMTPVVWEEMLLQWNLTLGKDVLVQTWQSDEAVAKSTSMGYKTLVGNYLYWYLDCGNGQWLDFRPGSSSRDFYPYYDYCAPVHNWRLMYAYDPLEGVPERDHHLVVGGEVHAWAEQTDAVSIDGLVWPRACAAAEVLWSGAKDGQGRNRSQIEASPRLSDMRERLVAMGIMARPIQMPFCLQNGTQCAL